MRRTYNAELLLDENGKFQGINLGADWCAEHEWGYKGLQRMFDMKKDAIGVERYICNKPVEGIVKLVSFTDRKTPCVSLYVNADWWHWNDEKDIKKYVPKLLRYEENEIAAAWDEKSFSITLHKKQKHILDSIVEALENRNLSMGIGVSHAFKNGGLKLMLVSEMSEEVKAAIKADHEDALRLQKAADATGIVKFVRDHGKRFYALSPRWKTENDRKTKYDVVFWLNPQQQSIHNFGWFTVEELKQWAEKDKGPCMKAK